MPAELIAPPNPTPAHLDVKVQSPARERDAVLRKMLPYDYEYALHAGLIDMFYYNPETGRDGLLHTLGGEMQVGLDGAVVVEGFHHEPSAEMVWPKDPDTNLPQTYVDTAHLASLNAKKRAELAQYPFEPYKAKVVVGGMEKVTVEHDKATGATELRVTKNGMFPKEYDPLMVMQAVRIAKDTRDKERDHLDGTGKVIMTEGAAPLIDGVSLMKIRLLLDKDTEKVISAFPIVKPGVMKLSELAIQKHLGLA